jgi:hypothetical protein
MVEIRRKGLQIQFCNKKPYQMPRVRGIMPMFAGELR